jgi:hypothetical protein
MVLCWGRAVRIFPGNYQPPRPPPFVASLRSQMQIPGIGLGLDRRPLPPGPPPASSLVQATPPAHAPPIPQEAAEMRPGDPAQVIQMPPDLLRREIIDLLAQYVAQEGDLFEKVRPLS